MAFDPEAARAAVQRHLQPTSEERLVDVHRVTGTALFSATVTDSSGSPHVGAEYLVTPDGRVWVLSSNGGIHDRQLAVALLQGCVETERLALVDPEAFGDRLAQMTADRLEAIREFHKDVIAGGLRRRPSRHLP